MVPLLKAWKRETQIDGMRALNDDLIGKNECSKMMEWKIVPKTIRRKRCIVGQMIAQVKTGLSAIKLNQGQNMICNKNNLKIMSKVINMECATKKGFIIGPNFVLSNRNACNKEINK